MEHGPAEGIDERTAKDRFSSEEKRALDRMQQDIYQEIRQAAEAHRQVCVIIKIYRKIDCPHDLAPNGLQLSHTMPPAAI